LTAGASAIVAARGVILARSGHGCAWWCLLKLGVSSGTGVLLCLN
jgi:hypothetical protein